MIDDEAAEAMQTTMRQELLQFVRNNARVYVDVDHVSEARGLRTEVEFGPLDGLWRSALGPLFGAAKNDPGASLRLEIDESDRTVALKRAPVDKGQDE